MTAGEPNEGEGKGRRRRVMVLSVVAGLVFAGALGPWVYAETRREPIFVPVPPSFRTDAERIDVRIGGHHLCIPANYLTGSQYVTKPDAKGEQLAVLVEALLPDLEGRTEENSDEFFLTRGPGRKLRILITKPGKTASDSFQIYINIIKDKWISKTPGKEKFEGLLWFRPIDSRRGYDVFTTIDVNSDITDIIQCYVVGRVPSPVCEHYFVHGELIFKASYGRNYLPEWTEMRKRATKLFSAFQACTSTHPGEGKDRD